MVRTLSGTLTAAVNSLTRVPIVQCTIEDHLIHYTSYQALGTADGYHDACIASDNSIVRVQVTRGGTGFDRSFQYQRITDPTQTSQWLTWTTLSGGSANMFEDGGCALSNNGGTLLAFAQRGTGGNDLWVWTSTTNGVSWTGPVSVLTPPGGALLKGIGSAGNHDVFFIYDVLGGENIGASFFSAGSWGALASWTLGTLSGGTGVTATWTGTSYVLAFSDGFTLSSCTYTPSGNVWGTLLTIAPATTTAITRVAPHLSFADGLYTLSCVEADSGVLTGAIYSYVRMRQSADLLHWSNGTILHDTSITFGAVLLKLPTPNSGSAGPRYYLVTLPIIYSAAIFQQSNPAQFLDVSGSVHSFTRLEEANRPTRLELLLDNTHGVYNALISTSNSYQPIGPNCSIFLSEGYKTGTPPTTREVVLTGTYHIAQIHIQRSPEVHQILLVGLDKSWQLDQVARYQNSYSNQMLSWLITEICTRAGLFAVALPTTTQVSQIITTFTLQAGQSYRKALDALCQTYGLVYFLDQNETMQFRELSATDPSVWSYEPEIELVSFGSEEQRANHVVVTGKPPVGGALGALTTAELFDDAHLHWVGLEQVLYHVDPKLTTTSQCSQKAGFALAQEIRDQTAHQVVVPGNPALQLFDVVTLTDYAAPQGSNQSSTARLSRDEVHFDAQQSEYRCTAFLEGL